MSDFIWNCKSYASFLKEDQSDFNYDTFKRILYGSNSIAKSSHNGYNNYHNRRINNTKENQDDQYKGDRRTDIRNQYYDSGRAYQDRERAYRRDGYYRNDDRQDYSHFDELERLSSCLIRLLGEARKEHCKVRKNFELPAQSNDTQQPKRRIETANIGESPPIDITKVQSNTDIGPVSIRDGSSQMNADSPMPTGICDSPTSMSEVESILNDLPDLDSQNDIEIDLNNITPSLVQVLPMNPVGSHNLPSAQKGPAARTLSTTPRGTHVKPLDRERKKKENHNMVERRRRSHINERIKELGSLLPDCDDAKFRRNKGSVLKASVEYIKQLQKDRERFGQIEERLRLNHFLHKKMLLRIQRLEALMEIQNWSRGLIDNSQEISTVVQPDTVNNVTVSREVHANATSANNQSVATETFDDAMSDSSSDSLFSSPPGSPYSSVL